MSYQTQSSYFCMKPVKRNGSLVNVASSQARKIISIPCHLCLVFHQNHVTLVIDITSNYPTTLNCQRYFLFFLFYNSVIPHHVMMFRTSPSTNSGFTEVGKCYNFVSEEMWDWPILTCLAQMIHCKGQFGEGCSKWCLLLLGTSTLSRKSRTFIKWST